MTIWSIIFGVSAALTGLALVYVSWRFARFGFMSKIARGSRRVGFILSVAFVFLAFLLVSETLNQINAAVVLLFLFFFWLLSDLLFAFVQKLRKKPFRRYYAGMAAILATMAYLSAGWYLNHNVWAKYYAFETEKDIREMRIVMFADSHIGTTFDGEGFAEHLQKMQELNPDIILIAGDYVDDDTSREQMLKASRALGRLETTYGVYLALGNHDKGYYSPARRGFNGMELVEELQKNGVRVLLDQSELVEDMFYVLGRKDSSEKYRGGSRREIGELTKNLNRDKFIIVMDHQPNDYQNLAASDVDLVLSGHTHGGQLFPFNKVGEWMGANDRTYGHERRGNTDFIVTSGLSDWAIKFKTGTKSEFVVVDIRKK